MSGQTGKSTPTSKLRALLRYLRKHGTSILLGFLTISSTGYGVARWEASQTFNGLTLYCISSQILQYPLDKSPFTRGSFVIYFGFNNPNWFPVNVAWSATPLLNDTNYFSGFLADSVPASSKRISEMWFNFIPPGLANYTLNRVVSYERYSIFGDIFSEPHVFFISSDQSIHLGNNSTNLIANRLPGILWSIFIQHSNLLLSQQSPCHPNDIP